MSTRRDDVELNKEYFIKVCNESKTMAEASRVLNLHFNTFKRYALEFDCYKPNQGGKGIVDGPSERRIKTKDILNGLYPNYQTFKLKKRLIIEGIKEDKCELCGWNKKIEGEEFTPCELHHKDGNSHNHKLENLIILCPNCHALQDHYRSRNKKAPVAELVDA